MPALLQAANEGLKPLAGMQHAVLGEGSSVYAETFQNCPRLTDKFLGECGSRRLAMRGERRASSRGVESQDPPVDGVARLAVRYGSAFANDRTRYRNRKP